MCRTRVSFSELLLRWTIAICDGLLLLLVAQSFCLRSIFLSSSCTLALADYGRSDNRCNASTRRHTRSAALRLIRVANNFMSPSWSFVSGAWNLRKTFALKRCFTFDNGLHGMEWLWLLLVASIALNLDSIVYFAYDDELILDAVGLNWLVFILAMWIHCLCDISSILALSRGPYINSMTVNFTQVQ